jgi:peptidoglycan/xylan/chitin deacetylase (PgdA/CDA1 family)
MAIAFDIVASGLTFRTRLRSLVRRSVRRTSIVLGYHRVASLASDPLGLSVSPKHFSEHVEVLAKWRRTNMADTICRKSGGWNNILVTFDDAYCDNLINARPILARHDVPAIVFASSELCSRRELFWWEVIRRLMAPAANISPQMLQRLYSILSPDSSAPAQTTSDLYTKIISALKLSSGMARDQFIQQALTLIGWDGTVDDGWPMNPGELAQISADGLIEIGAHTRTHRLLASLSGAEQEREIVGGKAELDEMLGRPTRWFAYPFGFRGDFNSTSVEIVRKAGFSAAFTFAPSLVKRDSDRFELGRFSVDDYDGDEFSRGIIQWFSW